jgi:hypothetical protein
VIRHDGNALGAEHPAKALDMADRRRVDDGRARAFPHELQDLTLLVAIAGHRPDLIREVRSIRPRVDHAQWTDAELRSDVGDDVWRRRRCECEDRGRSESAERRQRVQIRWAEIVPPLADAMRLVDHDEIDGTTGEVLLEIW